MRHLLIDCACGNKEKAGAEICHKKDKTARATTEVIRIDSLRVKSV